MNKFYKWLTALGLLLFAYVGNAAITADQIALLNKMNSIAAKVQLGTLIDNAEAGGVGAGDITTTELATGAVASVDILDGTIATADLDTSIITTDYLDTDAVTTGKIAADTILAGDIATSAVATAEILDGTILTGDISVDTIAAVDIATGGVATAEILDDTILVGDLNTKVMVEATGTLSAANIAAMNGAAVELLAAPGAGKVIIVDEIEFFHDYAVGAYTGGGDVTIEYETSGLDVNVFDVALVTAGADDNWLVKPLTYTSTASTSSHASLTANANKAILITNATAAFAGGDATNIIKWRIRYHVVTLLT